MEICPLSLHSYIYHITCYICLCFIKVQAPQGKSQHISSSRLRGSIIVELLYEIEFAAKECCNKDSDFAQNESHDLTEFKWQTPLGEFLEPTIVRWFPLGCDPSDIKGQKKNSVQRVIPVILVQKWLQWHWLMSRRANSTVFITFRHFV